MVTVSPSFPVTLLWWGVGLVGVSPFPTIDTDGYSCTHFECTLLNRSHLRQERLDHIMTPPPPLEANLIDSVKLQVDASGVHGASPFEESLGHLKSLDGIEGDQGGQGGKSFIANFREGKRDPLGGKNPPGGGVVFAFHFDLFGGMEGRL